jgi:hypothetical protein
MRNDNCEMLESVSLSLYPEVLSNVYRIGEVDKEERDEQMPIEFYSGSFGTLIAYSQSIHYT